jgi:hypothetical protein
MRFQNEHFGPTVNLERANTVAYASANTMLLHHITAGFPGVFWPSTSAVQFVSNQGTLPSPLVTSQSTEK